MSQLKCHHLGDLYRYDRLVASGDIEPHPDVPGDGFGYTVCGDCGVVFTAKEMLDSGIWPAIPA